MLDTRLVHVWCTSGAAIMVVRGVDGSSLVAVVMWWWCGGRGWWVVVVVVGW